jgi:hypothetical protein
MAAPQQPRFFTKVRDLGLKSDPNMHRAYRGPFRVRIEARQKWWRRQIFRQLVYQRINDRRCSPRSSSPVSWEGTFALLSRLEKPAAARKLISPFSVSPSGGKPGREGSPHAGSTLHASKRRWHAAMRPAAPTRGLPPPCASPAHTRDLSEPGPVRIV